MILGKKGGLGLGALCALTLTTPPTFAATVLVSRDDNAFTLGYVARRDVDDDQEYANTGFFGSDDSANSTVLLVQSASASGNGSINDTEQNETLVASGSGSASVTSTLAFNAGVLSSYTLSGSYAGSTTTGVLGGYEPSAGQPAATYVAAGSGGTYNSGINIITDVPLPYVMTVGQTNRVGTVFNAGLIYLDVNNNTQEDAGDVTIQSVFVVGNSPGDPESTMVTGVLAPSPFPYRIFFFGNTSESTVDDGTTVSASADFQSSFVVVPEPASITAVVLLGGALLARRRGW